MRRATLVLFFLAAALTAVVASSCFSDPKPNCAFSCGTASECPSDYACGDDGRCHLMDGEGNLLACETPLAPDASTADGGAVGGDAATADGGGADAGAIDAAAIDAPMIDASMIDAPVIDAPMIDAPMIDAAVIDAAVIDAAVIDAAVIDAAPMCSATLSPTADGAAAAGQALVIAEINPGDYIELYNNTGAPINLGASAYQFCSPFTYAALSTLVPSTIIAAGGRATVPWPSSFTDADAGGEIMLYADSNFGTSASIVDFVCWGSNPHGTRLTQAVTVGKWSGGCAPALSGGAIHRVASTTGTAAADYDVAAAPSGETCVP